MTANPTRARGAATLAAAAILSVVFAFGWRAVRPHGHPPQPSAAARQAAVAAEEDSVPERVLLAHAASATRDPKAVPSADAKMLDTLTRGGDPNKPGLDERWASESKDPRWALMEGEMRDLFAERELSDIQLVSLDCRTTLCRSEIIVHSPADLGRIAARADRYETLRGTVGVPRMEGDHVIVMTAPQQYQLDGTLFRDPVAGR